MPTPPDPAPPPNPRPGPILPSSKAHAEPEPEPHAAAESAAAPNQAPGLWLIAADRGGTFTDCYATDPQGRPHRVKLLSSGRLRTAVTRLGPMELAMETHASLPPDFFQNWNASLHLPCAPAPSTGQPIPHWTGKIAGSKNGILTLPVPLPDNLPPGSLVELDTGEPAPVTGARLLTHTPPGRAFPPHRFRLATTLATTLATNALLENQGAQVAFFVTKGFRDLLVIEDQRRSDLFALQHHRDAPRHHHTIEVDERLDATGRVLTPVDLPSLAAQAAGLARAGVRTAAVALAHSDLNPAHEQAVRDVLTNAGFTTISLSSTLAPQVRLLPRASTAVVDAALAPVIHGFVKNVRLALGPECLEFHCLTSAGGLAEPGDFHAKDSLLSGPAGGVAGSAAAAKKAAAGLVVGSAAAAAARAEPDILTENDCPPLHRILTLDMGGTSTDVARWEGGFLYQFEGKLGQSTILAPSLRIETVAAGGGSICAVTAGALTVGPRSAGADPGPACYGRGGPLTLTDVNLLLGRLDPARASIPLLAAPARVALEALKQSMRSQGLPVPDNDRSLLTGLLRIAIGRMAEALRSISVRDGCDPADYTLLAFGGAGPQHACAIAEELGLSQILVPADAGLLSATGAAASRPERFGQKQLLRPLGDAAWLAGVLTELESDTLTKFPGRFAGIHQRLAELRLQGQETALTLPFTTPGELPAAFSLRFQQLYGYPPPPHRGVEIVSLRVVAAPPEPPLEPETFPRHPTHAATGGTLILQDHFSTLILEPGWSATAGSQGSWLLRRAAADAADAEDTADASAPAPTASSQTEAATAELFRCRFQGLVDAMGELLRRTSVSTNVKERLDYSCALLDASGHLLVNAPHIPVHLGALGECVRRSTAELRPGPGDVIVTNDPAYGGSHLPDVTVIQPVFDPAGTLLGYTANRAHHAEIGGITPGSMPAFARNLAEEGVVIPPTWLVRNGESREEEIASLLGTAPWPTRSLPDNLADLRAQAAAARHGAEALLKLCRTHGVETVRDQLGKLTAQASQALSRTLAATQLTETTATEFLDDGTPVQVKLTKNGGRLAVDFTGSGPVHPGNRNATPAVVRSAVLYVLRLWTGEPIPLNEGFLDAVDIILPPGFLNPPFAADPAHSPAVVGGNVETSQRVVDALIRALGLQAGSQGTMNNVIFGNASFGHYETLCGGSGAGPGYAGTDAIHTHMTNTAITDMEIMERRYPVRLGGFSIRPDSGGAGRFRGGHGAIRTWHFLAPLTLSLLTEHRLTPPAGLSGGQPGACGAQFLILPDGTRRDLPGTVSLALEAGTTLHMHTPGGGGWGLPE